MAILELSLRCNGCKIMEQIPYGGDGFELRGSLGVMLMLLCMIIMSISVISMLVFACADDSEPKKHRTGGAGCGGGDGGGAGCGGGDGGGAGCGGGGCGGGGC